MMNDRLNDRMQKGNLRTLTCRTNCIDFTSNDYLGLARNKKLQKAIEEKVVAFNGCVHGSTGSRLLTGHSETISHLEHKIAQFHRAETALIYNSGYTANLGLLDALLQSDDCLIYDSQIHASIRDGLRLSRAKGIPFRHNDLDHLEMRLKSVQNISNVYVCVESVYSLDGSIAPLKEISELCQKYNARLIVDEAHAIGILGPNGTGLICDLGLEDSVFARVCTYGKAFGVHGAAILGSPELRQYLINFSRPFCYTTVMPMHGIITIDCAYDFVESADQERQHLRSLIEYLHSVSGNLKIAFVKSNTPIQGIFIPGNAQVKAMSANLADAGFDVRPIMSPTIKRGQEILRLCLHAFNTFEELEQLVKCLKDEKP